MTNKHRARVSLAMFHGPDGDAIIGPLEELIDKKHPPLYRSYRYIDFIDEAYKQGGNKRAINVLKLHH